uniref:MADF domain-containing protein n=1 Tax=Timema genevievae TaxID=629358 RepID=A0A7R9JW19_TIMGE|nr:unnamed protein product [Timema genevievae]
MERVAIASLNVEHFIEEIRISPAIWDMRCEEYSDKIKRSEAWREVARKCYPDFNSMEPAKQGAIVKDLNKKWKNLRQCYKRERDSQIPKSGAAKKKKTQYVYFDVLSFLAPVFTTKSTHSNVGDAEDGDEEEEGEMEEVPSVSQEVGTEKTNPAVQSSTAPSKRKRDSENPVADVCQLLKRSLQERMAAEKRKGEREEVDEDVNFLMSLLNYTHAVQEEQGQEVFLLPQVLTSY